VTLTREQILASRMNRKPVLLEVPEWGGDVYVRVMSAADQAILSDGVKPAELPIHVILHCLVDESGDRILTDEDAEALAKEDFPVIMRVFAFVAKLNGLSTKELEEAMENFGPSPNGSKSSESLLPLG
jgi:hypothetical protein